MPKKQSLGIVRLILFSTTLYSPVFDMTKNYTNITRSKILMDLRVEHKIFIEYAVYI